MRAPGLTWTRLPIFVWGVLSTAVLMVLAAPVLIAILSMGALDRTAQTSFFNPAAGGSAYLYQNLFWVFGHPEVYVLALPGFAIVLELLPVFARKPLWGYRLAVAGLLGVSLLSWFVWQHHLFVSGINGDLRPFYMLSTELISIPTGFTFLCGMMTIWRGKIRFTVPMLFCLAWFFNFLLGGLSGVFLSDVPSDVTTHGSFFSMAHFHYTIMGGLVFTFFAADLLLGAEDDRLAAERAAREGPLLDDVHLLQLDVRAALRRRLPRPAAPHAGLPEQPPVPQRLGLDLGVPARRLDAGLPLQPRLVARVREEAGRGEPVGVALDRVPAPVAGARAQLRPHPGLLERPVRLRRGAGAGSACRRARRQGGSERWPSRLQYEGTGYEVVEEEPPELLGRNLVSASYLLAGATAFFFIAFLFAYFYLRSLNNGGMWKPHGRRRLRRLGHGRRRVLRR